MHLVSPSFPKFKNDPGRDPTRRYVASHSPEATRRAHSPGARRSALCPPQPTRQSSVPKHWLASGTPLAKVLSPHIGWQVGSCSTAAPALTQPNRTGTSPPRAPAKDGSCLQGLLCIMSSTLFLRPPPEEAHLRRARQRAPAQ